MKESTREKRRTYTAVQYEVQDDTSLKKLTLKKFLSHIQTNPSEEQIVFAVFFNGTTVTNISSIDPQPLKNNHEETAMLLILHTLDVAK